MYEVKACVKLAKADQVVDALAQFDGVRGVAVVPLQEYGHAGGTGRLTKVAMVKLQLYVSAVEAADTVALHCRSSQNG